MSKISAILRLKLLLVKDSPAFLPRPYLGMSQLGAPCRRALWYSFRWCYLKRITDRQERIFERGLLEEKRIKTDLIRAGLTFDSEQLELIGFAGHCKGHIDGLISNFPGDENTVYLVEFKTAKDSSYTKFVTNGCKVANRQYYIQAQIYMKKLGLQKTLFIVANKDTEERYYEIISFNQEEAYEAEDIASDVIATDVPPAKIGSSTWYECKWCDAYQICHFNDPIVQNCRNCINSIIKDNGIWECSKFKKVLSLTDQALIRKPDSCYEPLINE